MGYTRRGAFHSGPGGLPLEASCLVAAGHVTHHFHFLSSVTSLQIHPEGFLDESGVAGPVIQREPGGECSGRAESWA